MTKRNVEIDDTLDERVDDIKQELQEHFLAYLKEHPELDDWDTYYQDTGADAIGEITDSNTPIYNSEIDDLYYLYGDEIDEAYKNAGIGTGTEDNHRQVAIYCLLEERAWDYVRELEETFKEWLALEETERTLDALKESIGGGK